MKKREQITANLKHDYHDRQWKNIRWTAETIRVDIETGERLTLNTIKNGDYHKHSTQRQYIVAQDQPRGTVIYTIIYERTGQTRLF